MKKDELVHLSGDCGDGVDCSTLYAVLSDLSRIVFQGLGVALDVAEGEVAGEIPAHVVLAAADELRARGIR